jgi:CheY-like chemotaxis protein
MTNGTTCLVVDDDPDLRDLEEHIIASEGHHVRVARDGREALARCAEEVPRLVLLDYNMPRMDGLEFAAEFRRRYGCRGYLVLVSADPDVARLAAQAGADAWLAKPFQATDILELLDRLFSGGALRTAA